ncbi:MULTISPECIES: flagellar basal body-associated protein FliL [Methylotenera]|uniref:flagellar basal body-associated protein FliL n=1 Tax=Methylotenera TaxID=359407 RepID=UPI00037C61EF|nr:MULTISPECIES: flagellar basal body-associated protein FliL [Methylotenera]
MAQQNEVDVIPPKKSKKIIILSALLLLGSAGGAGAWYYNQAPHSPKAVKEKPSKPPVFVSLDTFTINLLPDPAEQFLQVDITLQLADETDAALVKTHMPEVRNRLLMLLTTKKGDDISTLEGKKKLSTEISAQMNQTFTAGNKLNKVAGVFFTSFVIQ